MSKIWNDRIRRMPLAVGEASPYYLFHPHVPKRVSQFSQDIKLIVLLRNPVERAYSHYSHEVRRGMETSTFVDAIRLEEERLDGEEEKMLADEHYHSFNHSHFSYRKRGEYVDQLERWTSIFPRAQMLILSSERCFDSPKDSLERATEFLELPSRQIKHFEKFNVGTYAEMDRTVRSELERHFKPYNERLYEFLGDDLGW